MKRKIAKLNLCSVFNKKPIIKNGYVMALLVFIGLVVAFNIADSYDYYSADEVTGMAALGQSFGRITDLLDEVSQFIFKDLLEGTVIGSFISYTDAIIRLIIFIAVYLVVSGLSGWSGLVKDDKTRKVLSGLAALLTAVFTPQDVIVGIFGTPTNPGLFGGALGLIFWGAVIFLPLYLLFKYLRKADERFLTFLYGFLFLGWIFVISAVEGRLSIQSDLRDLWDLIISLGVLSCLVGAFWGIIVRGLFKGASKWSIERGAEKVGKVAGYDVTKPFKQFGRAYKDASGRGGKRKAKETENKELKEVENNRKLLIGMFSYFRKITPNEKDRTWLRALAYVNRRFKNVRNIRDRCKINNDEIVRLARKYGGVRG